MAKEFKSEVECTLGGEKFLLKLGMQQAIELEEELNCGIFELAFRMADVNRAKFREARAVIAKGLATAGEKIAEQRLMTLIENTGAPVIAIAAELLFKVITPNEDSNVTSLKAAE